MWVMLNDAFFSIVSKDCARDELLVRARRPGDIEKVFPGHKVIKVTTADYLYRTAVTKDLVQEAICNEVDRITYSNFKDSVQEKDLHDAYLKVWLAMAVVQPTRPYFGLSNPPRRKPRKAKS